MSRLAPGLLRGDDGVVRCRWVRNDVDYQRYHDDEWGRPVHDDRRLFEKICLEGFQAGLSWLTILRKREAFRAAFAGFDYETLARWNARSVERLLRDPGIVRHRGKIESVLNNARRACELLDAEGSLARWVWRFEPPPAARPRRTTWGVVSRMTETPESRALAKELKSLGWTFFGPTTAYAFMQSVGLVNDHIEGCNARPRAQRERRRPRR